MTLNCLWNEFTTVAFLCEWQHVDFLDRWRLFQSCSGMPLTNIFGIVISLSRTFRYSPANTPHVGQICTQLCLIQEPGYKIGLEKNGVTWFVLPPGGRIGFDLRRYFSNKTSKQYIWGKNYNSNYLGKVSFIQGQYYKFRKGYISVRKAWKSSQSDELLLEIHSFLKIYQCILTIHCSRFS